MIWMYLFVLLIGGTFFQWGRFSLLAKILSFGLEIGFLGLIVMIFVYFMKPMTNWALKLTKDSETKE